MTLDIVERIFSINYEALSEHLIMPGLSKRNLVDTIARGRARDRPVYVAA